MCKPTYVLLFCFIIHIFTCDAFLISCDLMRVTRVHHQFREKPGNPPVLLKDRTHVSLGLLSLPTSASLCTKRELNLHFPREMQAFHHLI
ncbi:hypothetical protein Hanom_Chr17g01553801 [Helianthus anomalus]